MEFIWIILGVIAVYVFYALISSKIIVGREKPKSKCDRCSRRKNCTQKDKGLCDWLYGDSN